MTFQAYLDNIKAKTGKTPEELNDLGHGHSLAIWAVFKSRGWVKSPKKK